jgi:hypothetical protein
MQWVLFYFFLHHQNDFSFSHTIIALMVTLVSILTLTYYAVGAFLFFFTPSNDFFIFLDHNCSDNNNNDIFSPYLLCSGCFYTPLKNNLKKSIFSHVFSIFSLWSQPHFCFFALTDYHVKLIKNAFKKKCKKKGFSFLKLFFKNRKWTKINVQIQI